MTLEVLPVRRLSAITLALIGTVAMFDACTEEKNPAQQYGNTMVQSLQSAKSTKKKENIAEVQKSIQEFYAANGKYPENLDELKSFNGITLESDNYEYDPTTGSLIKKQ